MVGELLENLERGEGQSVIHRSSLSALVPCGSIAGSRRSMKLGPRGRILLTCCNPTTPFSNVGKPGWCTALGGPLKAHLDHIKTGWTDIVPKAAQFGIVRVKASRPKVAELAFPAFTVGHGEFLDGDPFSESNGAATLFIQAIRDFHAVGLLYHFGEGGFVAHFALLVRPALSLADGYNISILYPLNKGFLQIFFMGENGQI